MTIPKVYTLHIVTISKGIHTYSQLKKFGVQTFSYNAISRMYFIHEKETIVYISMTWSAVEPVERNFVNRPTVL